MPKRSREHGIESGSTERLRKKSNKSKKTSKTKKLAKVSWADQVEIKNIVNRLLSKRIEAKQQMYSQIGVPVYNATNNSINMQTSDVFGVSPNAAGIVVQQGTSQEARVGNRIKTRSCIMRGYLYPLPYDATTNPTPSPQDVYLYIFRMRQDGDLTAARAAVALTFFQVGDADVGAQGSPLDWLNPINKDDVIVYHRQLFKVGFAAYTGTGTSAVYQADHNNDMQISNYFEIDLTAYLAKNVVFNDNTATPTSYKTYCWLEAVTAGDRTGTAADDVQTALDYSLIYDFEDA